MSLALANDWIIFSPVIFFKFIFVSMFFFGTPNRFSQFNYVDCLSTLMLTYYSKLNSFFTYMLRGTNTGVRPGGLSSLNKATKIVFTFTLCVLTLFLDLKILVI